MEDSLNYTLPYKIGTYLEREDEYKIVDQVISYVIDKSGLQAILLVNAFGNNTYHSRPIPINELVTYWHVLDDQLIKIHKLNNDY